MRLLLGCLVALAFVSGPSARAGHGQPAVEPGPSNALMPMVDVLREGFGAAALSDPSIQTADPLSAEDSAVHRAAMAARIQRSLEAPASEEVPDAPR